jgi:GT2 family glycosyltransferase
MRTIIANKFDDVIQPLLKSLEKFNLRRSDVIIIRDGHDRIYNYATIRGIEPFIFSRQINLGIRLASAMDRLERGVRPLWTGKHSDVFLANDDVTIEQPDFFAKLKSITESMPKTIGILGALVSGGVGNPYQRYPCVWGTEKFYFVPGRMPVCFVAVWLRGRMLDQIGLLDERFAAYGGEDNDTCNRARAAGWSCALSSEIWCKHGSGGPVNIRGENWSKSFARVDPEFKRDNMELLRQKESAIAPVVAKLALK